MEEIDRNTHARWIRKHLGVNGRRTWSVNIPDSQMTIEGWLYRGCTVILLTYTVRIAASKSCEISGVSGRSPSSVGVWAGFELFINPNQSHTVKEALEALERHADAAPWNRGKPA